MSESLGGAFRTHGLRSRVCRFLGIVLLCLGGSGQGRSAEATPKGTYLVLVSYNAWRPTVEAYLEGFVGGLHAGGVSSRQIAVEYMDADRLDTPAQRQSLKELIQAKYGGRKITFFVVIQQPATDFFEQELAGLSPGTPALIVQGQVRQPRPEHPLIFEAPRWDFAGTLGLGLRLFPATRHVLLLTGSGPDDRALLTQVRSQLANVSSRVDIQDTLGQTYEQVMEEVGHLPPGTLIMPLYFNRDGKGEFHLGTEMMEAVHRTANAPILGYFEDVPPLGVCGSMNSLHGMGAQAAQAALDLTSGQGNLQAYQPSLKASPKPVADWNQLKAWRVDLDDIPPSVVVLNRPPNIWTDYRGWVLGAVVFLSAELLLILALLLERRYRKAAARSLRESEERFRILIEQSPVPILLSRMSRLIYANPAMARSWGYSEPKELEGASLAEIVAPEDLPRIQARSTARWHGEDPSISAEFLARRRDGTTFPVYSSVIRVMLPDGPAIIAFLLDLTELKASEEARFRMEVKLQQSAKLEAIGRLASGVAHDINNMISVVMGHCELLRSLVDPPGSPKVLKHIHAIESASERSKGIVSQLLAFSRKQSVQPQLLDLNLRVRATLENLGPMLGDQAELRLHLAEGLRKVWMDPIQVDQVLLNLAVNARDAMPQGGAIEVTTRNLERLQGDAVEGQPPGPWVELTVKDEGTGMTREVLDRVFEPFFTTKAEGKGTGLGLATVFGIVQQAGGTIAIESEPGQGTAFRIALPAAEAGPT